MPLNNFKSKNMLLKHYKTFIVSSIAILLVAISCYKKPDVNNPFDTVDYLIDTTITNEDIYSLSNIHHKILQPKCGTPGCHDGSFEPDFSTLMSTYSTLVYHPIVKNNAQNSFKYRVVPFNSAESVLYERITNCCFVNTNDRMPQDNIGRALPDADIAAIKKWIDDGAKDFLGNVANKPNAQPVFQWFYGIEDKGFPLVWNTKVLTEENNRVDKMGYGSVILDTHQVFIHIPVITDDETALKDLKNARVIFSTNRNDFSSPIATVNSIFLPVDEGIWYNRIVAKNFPQNTVIYMRYLINDGSHVKDTESPDDLSPSWFKNYWSFIVIPGSHPK
jgi:hypothetical protein